MSYPAGRKKKHLWYQMDMTKIQLGFIYITFTVKFQNWIYPWFTRALESLVNASRWISDPELVQSRLPLDDILGCKAALIRPSLAYIDVNKRLKVLVPIQEYVGKNPNQLQRIGSACRLGWDCNRSQAAGRVACNQLVTGSEPLKVSQGPSRL
jgi:hypothetical protein